MSKITNDSLTQSGTRCFVAVPIIMTTMGVKGLYLLQLILTNQRYITASLHSPLSVTWPHQLRNKYKLHCLRQPSIVFLLLWHLSVCLHFTLMQFWTHLHTTQKAIHSRCPY